MMDHPKAIHTLSRYHNHIIQHKYHNDVPNEIPITKKVGRNSKLPRHNISLTCFASHDVMAMKDMNMMQRSTVAPQSDDIHNNLQSDFLGPRKSAPKKKINVVIRLSI
jgi:hypothetical protein